MNQQSNYYTTVADWHVRAQKREDGAIDGPWVKCCDRWVTNVTPLAAAQEILARHTSKLAGHYNLAVYNGDTEEAPWVLTLSGDLIHTPDAPEGFTEEGFQAVYGVNPDRTVPADDTPNPSTLLGPDPQRVRVTGPDGEEVTGQDRDQILSAVRDAASEMLAGDVSYHMITEDQVKRAAVELEEALRGVLTAQAALSRKGAWWCYQDALKPVALAASVYTAAYLNWEATL